MSAPVKIAILVVLCLAQLAAAGSSIVKYETTLRSGALYRIRSIPIDPADAFRGRYVAVSPSITIPAPIDAETERLLLRIQSGERGYVVLATDDEGFARVGQILMEPPAQGDYLAIASAWPQWTATAQDATRTGYTINFSFDRYYMNEQAAPEAENQFRAAARRNSASRAWLTVRVRNGAGVIEGLFVDGVPIEQLRATQSK
jgi:uncharacterized membrane-anchored protein